MKKLASAGMKLLEEVLLISLPFGYQPGFGLEQFCGARPQPRVGRIPTSAEKPFSNESSTSAKRSRETVGQARGNLISGETLIVASSDHLGFPLPFYLDTLSPSMAHVQDGLPFGFHEDYKRLFFPLLP
jgi:hypothetical protein